jgi:hypothetical protein
MVEIKKTSTMGTEETHMIRVNDPEIEKLKKDGVIKSEEKKAEQPKEEKQLETKVETKQPEPKKDNVVTANERLKAN